MRENCQEIHAFGLGFIQIKLGLSTRVHLYTDKVKQTTEPEEVHDHRYGFTSDVLMGSLTNELYHVNKDPEGNFTLREVTCKKGVEGESEPLYHCELKSLGKFIQKAGSSYALQADTFHRVSASEGTLTFLTRDPPPYPEHARVVGKRDRPLVCPFSANTFTVEELWGIYEGIVL